MDFLKSIFYTAAKPLKFVPLKYFIRFSKKYTIFPLYHLVSDEDVIHIRHLYKIRSVKQFISDLDFLLKEYHVLNIEDLLIAKEGRFPKCPSFLLTFDDGLREFHDVVAPILLQKGIPAICFLNSGFIDNKALFYRYKASIVMEHLRLKQISQGIKKKLIDITNQHNLNFDSYGNFLKDISYKGRNILDESAAILEIDFTDYLLKKQPYLTSSQISRLISQGFGFGAHSIDHPDYSELTFDQQIQQTGYSIREISEKFDLKYRFFSFPFTDDGISSAFFEVLFNLENSLADLSFACAGLKSEPCAFNIQRIPFEYDNFTSKEILYGEYLYYIFKSAFNKNIIYRV